MPLDDFTTRDFRCGDQFFRPEKSCDIGAVIPSHSHNFVHATIAMAGWHLVQLFDAAGGIEREAQLCAPQYRYLRRLQSIYEPASILRPIRWPDNRFTFIGPDDAVPDGGEEIHFRPTSYVIEIAPRRTHSIVNLSGDGAHLCCYANRDPNTGGKVIGYNGWFGAFE